MPKVQTITPDPDYSEDESTLKKLGKHMPPVFKSLDVVGPLALAAGLEHKRREVKAQREADESKAAALQNQKKYGMKKGGTASSRADGCCIRGKTRGKMV